MEEILNSLDDCDIPEKVINLTYVHKHNDALVSIKVQEFRSRYAKYVYYNCCRVVCEICMATNVIVNQAEYQ